MLSKIFWLAIFICLPAFGQFYKHNTGIDVNDPKYAAKERRAYFNQQLNRAKKVVDLTQDPEAKMIYSFLADEAIIIAPIFYEGGVQILLCDKPRNNNFISLLVVFKKDLDLDSDFRAKMTKKGVGSSYNPDTKILVIKEWANLSDLCAGLLLLHEARHAYENIISPYDWHDQHLFCDHERTTHEFENRLIAKIGGTAYQKILSKEVARIARANDSAKVDWRKSIVNTGKIYGLEKVFGPSISDYDRNMRCTHVWIDAYFHFYAQKCSSREEAIEAEDKFLLNIYKKAKVLD